MIVLGIWKIESVLIFDFLFDGIFQFFSNFLSNWLIVVVSFFCFSYLFFLYSFKLAVRIMYIYIVTRDVIEFNY